MTDRVIYQCKKCGHRFEAQILSERERRDGKNRESTYVCGSVSSVLKSRASAAPTPVSRGYSYTREPGEIALPLRVLGLLFSESRVDLSSQGPLHRATRDGLWEPPPTSDFRMTGVHFEQL